MTDHNRKNNKTGGYTIIETMIAVSLFLIIVVAGVGALLNANLVHNKSEDMRSIMDNLTFIMEDMSRHIRTGYNYRCYFGGESWETDQILNPILNEPRSCDEGGAIAFEEAYGVPVDGGNQNVNDQWIYKIESSDGGETFHIYKSVDGGQRFVRLNDSAVVINGDSSVSVLGAESPQNSNLQQPLVTIRLMGEIHYKSTVTPFSLQTSVSQRLIDIAF